jgi:hypothetical protein
MTPEQQCAQQWEFYLCSIDEAPASILVDMSLASTGPIADLPFLAFIRLRLQMPGPEGMSSTAELDQLTAIEDHLLVMLPRTGAARYVGRCTAAGRRDFYFYIARAEHWQQRAAAAMARFSHFEFEAATREERDWETYFEVLCPEEEDLQRIQNRRVCDVLEENGDELITARDIEHWAYFPDTAARARFMATVQALGFEIHELWDEQEASRCGIRFSRIDLPSFTGIDEVTLPLYQAALEAGGDYDGWETQVIRK